MMRLPRIALTSGEPAGIGPELCAAVARGAWPCELVCLGDRALLAERAASTGGSLVLHDYRRSETHAHVPGELRVAHAALGTPSQAGRLDRLNASYVLALLDTAMSGAITHEFDAIVTAPVQKSLINEAGIAFTGHTEYLAAHSGIARPVMLLVAGNLRVALATTHLPLREVSATITGALLREVLDVLATDLARLYGLARPRILVCGVNPHAGESGHLGREELDVIAPALEDARARGLDVTGPVPADTAFVPAQLARHDAVLAMYHDQGLPVLKHAGFGRAVNVTLGLPFIRTSVDHGTALDLAGTGRADPGSLEAALALAIEMANRRR
ncbi:MAG: 4-hydroxythreonine-4-phosphate dehydrogenase PdxA [Steroidobacteraceae bacterium]